MNDQAKMMSQKPPQIPMMAQQPPPPPQILSQPPLIAQSPALSQSQMMMMKSQPNPQQPLPMLNPNLNRSFNIGNSNKVWSQQQQVSKVNYATAANSLKPSSKLGRSNWKGKNVGGDKRKDFKPVVSGGPSNIGGGIVGAGGYKPPALHELQSQNRLKARKFYQKKKFNNTNNNNNGNIGKNNRFAPYAPRNTTSFIIRAKKAGGIADLVSPCPVTPAVLPTPIFSPSREILGDMAKEEWGVDGYGSMKGLIRLRSPGHEHELVEEEEDENGGSSESDVEEHVEVERRLDHDLSRFEMIYPNYSGVEYNNVLENRVDDQDSHIAQLEEENLTLKERLFLMEREMGDLRRRLQFLERQSHVVAEDANEEVVENGSENDSDGGLDAPATAMLGCENNGEYGSGSRGRRHGDENDGASDNECVGDVCMGEFLQEEKVGEERDGLVVKEVIAEKNESKGEEIVKDNVVMDEEMRTEAKNEEARSEFVTNEVNAAREDEITERKEFVQDGGIAGKDVSMNEELGNVCSEKSIGDGD
ncbi:hypothetical protein RGQ29_001733 [Quercus rubra]|uniref:PRLI-interacting factor A n=1 Tax=Quercus rubra TaxID=3512 RepID=A0AAN7G6L9_QUERU|nr:hypothetical protein RGQ29_001733 [Quercus rubra]KAK4608028.1 hypothetical protein RGQ29_001733 [Quercus rubra]KAK4608029.1 hypothetical protein RGQ29_001733 [Quercus rubra]KAK4608030.1 hypothetical protein RGQ29_001733 [Quercus rubra]KAK4608031.1 hypothetical protein RGQ29_001733 [Quercus rubra]